MIAEGVSYADMRKEVERIEETMQEVLEEKDNLLSRSIGVADFDLKGFKARIKKEVIDEIWKAKIIALKFLKDSDLVSPATTVEA